MNIYDYTNPETLPEGPVKDYVLKIQRPRKEIVLWELINPPYVTEEDFGHIHEAWIKNRDMYYLKNGEGLPKPKRKSGRPIRTDQKYVDISNINIEEAPIGHIRNYVQEVYRPKEEVDLIRVEYPAYDTPYEFNEILKWSKMLSVWWKATHGYAIPKPKRRQGRPVIKNMITLRSDILRAIERVRGDLSTEECTNQLLRHTLGPLCE